MRVYFHLVNGHETMRDTEGVEVTSLEDVPAQAELAIKDVVEADASALGAWAGWRLVVCDASEAVLFSIDLEGAGSTH